MKVLWLCALLATWAAPVRAQEMAPATVAVVIDDLGDSLLEGRRVVALPGPVACAILPHTSHSEMLADEAYAKGKEILLHLPMEPVGHDETGPGELDSTMPALELVMMFDYDLSTVPHAVGVNNHMGSRLTQDRNAMRIVMHEIHRHGGLFFVDSLTTPNSVAAEVAREQGVPALVRQVFLDDDRHPAAIDAQFDELLRIARERGQALAIGHPYPETLDVLERRLPQLAAQRVQLVPLSSMLGVRSQEVSAWPLSSSRWLKVPKSSRP